MKALVQRVSKASVTIDGKIHGEVGNGLLIFLGVRSGDTVNDAVYVAEKCSLLRIFEDQEGKMNLSVQDTNGEVLVISQFTLYADTRKGNRPNFMEAAPPAIAETLYEAFVEHLRTTLGKEKIATGVFGAMMDIALVNSGPVTIMIESK